MIENCICFKKSRYLPMLATFFFCFFHNWLGRLLNFFWPTHGMNIIIFFENLNPSFTNFIMKEIPLLTIYLVIFK